VRFFVAAFVLLGLLLPATGAARIAAKSWANGVIARVGPETIAVRGTVSLTLPNGSGGTAKSTLDGIRLLTCSVARASAVNGYHVRSRVSITCDGGVLSHIVHGG